MLEQLADRYLFASRHDTRQVVVERVAQAKLALIHELKHDRRVNVFVTLPTRKR